jgi:molybdopterin converting factor small subunit
VTSASALRVVIPTPLRSYTGQRQVEGSGATLGELLADLDRRYPGLRFRVIDEQDRIRPHIRLFVSGEQALDLAQALRPADTIHIVPALSGG